MIRVAVGDRLYRLSFSHCIYDEPEIEPAAPLTSHKVRGFTQAFLTPFGSEFGYEGIAWCSESDRFEKELGRRRALEDLLLEGFTRDERREIWECYFGRLSNS